MKNTTAIALFLCIVRCSIGQTYQPFPADSAMWREWAYDVDVSYNDTWDYQYFTNGDTVISGKNYHKTFYTGIYTNTTGSGTNVYNFIDQYKGCYREDFAKHILFCPTGSVTEQLLYDFNLSLGDTLLPAFNIHLGEIDWVSAIDSVIVGGQYHKQYHISGDTASAVGNANFVSLIEGVGSTFGLLGELRPVFESETHLSCYTHRGQTEYTDSATTNCNPVVIGIAEHSKATPLFIFPNPTTGIINVRRDGSEKTEILLIDVLGNIIYRSEFLTRETEINLSRFPQGVYFLKALSGNKISTTQKVILK